MDPLRLYVVFDPAFSTGPQWVDFFLKELNALGMTREEGARTCIPVYFRSEPWQADQPGLPGNRHPRRVDLSAAGRNCILLLADARMKFNQTQWSIYYQHIAEQIKARGEIDLLVPVLLADNVPSFVPQKQCIRDQAPEPPAGAGAERLRNQLLVRLLNAILVHRDPAPSETHRPGHGVFVSHAKRDGRKTAERIVEAICRVNQGLGPRCFFDADSLLPGQDYPERFVQAIESGSLLAVVTDAYHTRPWCRWEVLTAKRFARPLVAAELRGGRIERTYPYLGNVPSIRIEADATEGISDATVEQLARALLEEALRVELWRERAQPLLQGKQAHLLVRPPELADLATLPDGVVLVIYPDPPLSTEELELLNRAFPRVTLRTPSQLLS